MKKVEQFHILTVNRGDIGALLEYYSGRRIVTSNMTPITIDEINKKFISKGLRIINTSFWEIHEMGIIYSVTLQKRNVLKSILMGSSTFSFLLQRIV